MSQAKKCDLCFNFYDAYPDQGTILRGRLDDSCHNIDVCPTCRLTLGLEKMTCECSAFRLAVIQLLQRALESESQLSAVMGEVKNNG